MDLNAAWLMSGLRWHRSTHLTRWLSTHVRLAPGLTTTYSILPDPPVVIEVRSSREGESRHCGRALSTNRSMMSALREQHVPCARIAIDNAHSKCRVSPLQPTHSTNSPMTLQCINIASHRIASHQSLHIARLTSGSDIDIDMYAAPWYVWARLYPSD
ncbi:unnamed protein product [Clonostachys rosea]|uniref:Uncharacterized protein n=1 Tax=Bionectria ochroleuca TaxID=29856 RepID=A0ABY6V130_BIOOC|nr:unnamed protein product [Clonostachys rosea]